jgi:hypothetical protein
MRNRIRKNEAKERIKRKRYQLTEKIETLRKHTNRTTGRRKTTFDHFPREGTSLSLMTTWIKTAEAIIRQQEINYGTTLSRIILTASFGRQAHYSKSWENILGVYYPQRRRKHPRPKVTDLLKKVLYSDNDLKRFIFFLR